MDNHHDWDLEIGPDEELPDWLEIPPNVITPEGTPPSSPSVSGPSEGSPVRSPSISKGKQPMVDDSEEDEPKEEDEEEEEEELYLTFEEMCDLRLKLIDEKESLARTVRRQERQIKALKKQVEKLERAKAIYKVIQPGPHAYHGEIIRAHLRANKHVCKIECVPKEEKRRLKKLFRGY